MEAFCGVIADFGKWQFAVVLIGFALLLAWEATRGDNDRIAPVMCLLCALLLAFWLVLC